MSESEGILSAVQMVDGVGKPRLSLKKSRLRRKTYGDTAKFNFFSSANWKKKAFFARDVMDFTFPDNGEGDDDEDGDGEASRLHANASL